MKAAQRGAGMLVAVILIVTVAAFAVIVAASQSGADIQGNDAHADSLQALYLAETGVERAVKRFATAVIVDRNLLEGPDNPTFDNPLTGATPSGWTALNPGNAFAADGGPDGTAPNCSRSAWTAKDNPPGQPRRATATVPVQFTLTAGSVTTITFYRRVITRTVDCGANLPLAGAALPPACLAGSASTVCFELVGLNTVPAAQTWTVGSNAAAVAGPGIAACPTTFNPCSASYPGYPAKSTVTVTMTNAASVSQFRYHLQVQQVGRKEIFLDHIEATNPTAIGAAHVRVWRDCSTAADPVSCL
jgi:hypothetical protein